MDQPPSGSDQSRRPLFLITGANRGIGQGAAKLLAAAGHVIVVGRTDVTAQQARDSVLAESPQASVSAMSADLSSFAEVRALADRVSNDHEHLDVLIHNAAIIDNKRRESRDGIELQFQVNHLAPFLLTARLQEPLRRAAGRVVVVASEAHRRARLDIDDLQFVNRSYSAGRAYSQSKLANVMFTYALARRWWRQISVNAVHPGVVSTQLLGGLFGPLSPLRFMFRSAHSGAAPVVRLATDESLGGVSGSYYKRFDAVKSSQASYDKIAQAALWDASESLVGESFPQIDPEPHP